MLTLFNLDSVACAAACVVTSIASTCSHCRWLLGRMPHQAVGVVHHKADVADGAPAHRQPRQALLAPEAAQLAARQVAKAIVGLACAHRVKILVLRVTGSAAACAALY